MRIWRRKRSPPPVVLPSLDRLSGLIERVIELVDEVAGAPASSAEHAPEPAATTSEVGAEHGWLAFVASPEGYTLVDLDGTPPARGAELELDDLRYRVLRHAPSPLPGDRRRCVVVEREERLEAERTSDA